MEPFELDPADWLEVSEVMGRQLAERGLAGDLEGFAEVLRLDWHLLINQGRRKQALLHGEHKQLDERIIETDASLTGMRNRKTQLPRDPGPPKAGP